MRARIGLGLLAALAPASMLAVDPGSWFPFGPIKWLALSLLLPAGAALLLAERPLRVRRPLGIALVSLVGAMAVAAAVGLDPTYAWTGTPERHLGVVTWALAALALAVGCSLTVGQDAPWVLTGLAVAAAGIGVVSTAEALGWEPAVLDVGSRLTATFGSSAYLGAATALLLPAMVGLAADRQLAPGLRRLAATAVPLLVVASVGSGARAAWVGLAAAAAAVAFARRRMLQAHRRLVAAVALAGAAAMVGLLALTPAGGRVASIGDPDEPGGTGRVDEWRVAARVLADHPLTGVGPEGYRVAFADGVDAAYERDHGRDPHPDRAHAGPLDVALAGGAPALVAWLAVVAIVGTHVLRALRSGVPWLAGVAAGLVAHLVGQLFLFPLVELELVVWLLAGLVVAATPPGPIAGRLVPRFVPLVLAAVAGVALASGITGVAADRRARDAVDALAAGEDGAAAAAAADAVALRPDVVRLRVLAAAAFVQDERGTLAGIRQLDHALNVSPGDPIVLRERLVLLVARADATRVPAHIETARQEIDRMLERDPHDATTWQQAELLALVEGDQRAADEAGRRRQALTPDDGIDR